MRKLFTALTLLLCLVLCVFAFASCDKKSKGDAKTSEATTSAHTHVPNAVYTVDVAPTCITKGSKSNHCSVCGQIIPETVVEIDADPSLHVVDDWETVEPTLLANGSKTGVCQVCDNPVNEVVEFEHDIQIFTTSGGKYTPGYATLGEIRGDKHLYDAGNDMLIEYSILWNETLLGLYKTQNTMPTIDTRFTTSSSGTSGNSGIVRWELADDVPSPWCACKHAGGFEVAAFTTSEYDSPYPNFDKVGGEITSYPNIGGANEGDGQPLGDMQWGWHRVSIRYRETVTNVDAVKGGADATYKLEVWVYIDGVLVLHNSASDHRKEDGADRKAFSAETDNAGGITYTENDSLFLHGAFLDSKKMTEGKGYFEIADYSVTVGTDFVQNVRKVTNPVATQLEVEADVFVPSTMWYELAD